MAAERPSRQRVPSAAFEAFLATPPPKRTRPVSEAALLALDLETTGLKPKSDAILSIGAVAIVGGAIDVGSAFHMIVKPDTALPVDTGAVIHGLGHDRLATGMPLSDALDRLWPALAGRLLVAHGAALERDFLDQVCRRFYGERFRGPVIDTLTLEQRRPGHRREQGPGTLRLDAVRRRYGLPRYRAHHALSDALACAELFLAQSAYLGDDPPLRKFLP
mgnify:CR=1 FL=1